MVCILVALQFWVSSWKDNTKVKPLSEISNIITVQNNKVTIDKLPSQYSYKEINYDDKFLKDSTNIFKFETVDFYETSYLIGEDGTKITLNVDDTKYLKEKGAK
jgi:hypothetical protein